MKYAVNEEGVQAMKTMADSIIVSLEAIQEFTRRIQSTSDDYQDTLGPHKASLDDALEDIESILRAASEPAESVAEQLNDVAESYEEIIENDRLRGIAGK